MKHEQVTFNADGIPIRVSREINTHEKLSVVPLHMHDELEILVGVSGKLAIEAAEERVEIEDGDIAIVGCRVPHLTEKLVPYTAYILLQLHIDLPTATLPSLSLLTASRERSLTLLPSADCVAREVCRLVKEIRTENLERREGYRYFIRSHVALLLGVLYRSSILCDPATRTSDAALERIRPALARIDAEYAETLSLSALAEAVHLTPEYFCRIFKQTVGLSPVEYVNRVRVLQSEQLLRDSELSVTQIALEVGFSSISYFNRIFRKYRGMTPTEYRRVVYSKTNLM